MIYRATEQVNLSKVQVQLCDQMKLAMNKYFASLEHFQELASSLLNDFKTPRHELAEKAKRDMAIAVSQLEQNNIAVSGCVVLE